MRRHCGGHTPANSTASRMAASASKAGSLINAKCRGCQPSAATAVAPRKVAEAVLS